MWLQTWKYPSLRRILEVVVAIKVPIVLAKAAALARLTTC